MNGVKPWQLAVIVLGLLGGTGLLVWNATGEKRLRKVDELVLMDVVTGDRFVADVRGRRAVILPAKHPETMEYTLLPIAQDDDGKWRIHRLRDIGNIPLERLTAVEDFESGLARPSSAKPKPLRN